MYMTTWGEVFTASLQSLWLGFVQFVPSLVIAIIIFLIGWAVGTIVSKAISQVIGALKVDKLFQSLGAEQVLSRAGFRLDVGRFVGEVVKWFIVLVALIVSFDIVGLSQVTTFLREIVIGYLPQVFIAAIIIIAATIIADAVSRVAGGVAKAGNVSSANMIGSIAKYAIWTFAIIIALSELGIAPVFMQTLFQGIIAMVVIAGGLAFGLGGKDAAARMIDRVHNDMK